jgi:hypothetical protein
MTTAWHLDETTIDGYVGGGIGEARAASVEAHVIACATCRAALADRVDVEAGWTRVRDRIERPRVGVLERGLRAVGVRHDLTRLLATSPTVRGPWLVAVALSLAFAVVASRSLTGDPLPFLVLAPLVPIAGIAAAFGRPIDPLWELGIATPTGGFRLMLLRAATVLATSLVLTGLGALALPGRGWAPAAWLLPSLCLTLLALAVSSLRVSPAAACGLAGVAWLVAIAVAERSGDVVGALAAGGWMFAGVGVAAGIVIVARRGAFERVGPG